MARRRSEYAAINCSELQSQVMAGQSFSDVIEYFEIAVEIAREQWRASR
jgi:hypothetical protein